MTSFDYYNLTVINPYAFSLLIIMSLVVLFAKRKYMIIPLIIIASFITNMQRLVIFGIDLPFLRILIMLGLLRFIISSDRTKITINKIDKFMIYWIIVRTLAVTVLYASANGLIYMLGESIDVLGAYFFVRLAISDFKEYDAVIKTLVLVSIPIAVFMIIEHKTGGRNYFSVFGGVPEYNLIREGKLRAQSAFSHPIMAGTFGALLLPLSWAMWQRKKRIIALFGVVCSIIITLASSSSGPVVTFGMGLFGIFFWRFNKYTGKVRNLFFLSLLITHIVMKKPVWHLISRIDIVGGSTGYHRYNLINAAVNHFSSWCILGTRTSGSWGFGLNDVTNQYLVEGFKGGIIPLILFITILTKCFQTVGVAKSRLADYPVLQKYVWALGVVLFAHVVTFISVSYFGQMVFFYYLMLAMISSLNDLPEVKNSNMLESKAN